jgi:hypothetical protein
MERPEGKEPIAGADIQNPLAGPETGSIQHLVTNRTQELQRFPAIGAAKARPQLPAAPTLELLMHGNDSYV